MKIFAALTIGVFMLLPKAHAGGESWMAGVESGKCYKLNYELDEAYFMMAAAYGNRNFIVYRPPTDAGNGTRYFAVSYIFGGKQSDAFVSSSKRECERFLSRR